MKLEITQDKSSKIKFKVVAKLDAKDLAKQKEKVVKKLGKGIKIQGFRAGSAPTKLIEEKLGADALARELAGTCVDVAFMAMVKEFELDLIGQPKLEITEFKPDESMLIEFIGNTKPEVKLADYKKWPKVKLKSKADPKDVDEMINQLAENMAEEVEVKRAVKLKDKVWFDFDGEDQDGVKVPGASSKNFPLIVGSRSFIPGFEEELVGMKVDEEKTFTVTFPKDYHAESLRSKPVTFKIKIIKICELKKPELDDKFAEKVGGFKSFAKLKEDVELEIAERAKRAELEEIKDQLAKKLAAESELEVPDILLEENIEFGVENTKRRAEASGVKFEDWLKEQKFKDEADFIKKEATPKATENIRISLSLRALAERENLEVDKDELLNYTKALLEQYQNPQAQQQILSSQEQARIEGQLLADKVLNYLVEACS
jgi:trigger factor